ncbi:MAG: hypothetical protein JW849_00410 [Phycisphaerae bacterium]|nr:hypothetical protein [Phycisphaerae bacterium]
MSWIYGTAFSFAFPAIAIHPETETIPEFPPYVLRAENSENRPLHSHGKVKALCFDNDKYVGISPVSFKTKDNGWVMKPGQCVTEFWISWGVLNPTGSPVKTTIKVKGRKLIIDPGKNNNRG